MDKESIGEPDSGRKIGDVLETQITQQNGQIGGAHPEITTQRLRVLVQDALFDPNAEVNYKTMSWWHVGLLMIAETISLGILSLPYSVAQLGLVPGILSIVLLGLLATYSGFVIGQFKLRHPHVHSMADAGYILFGRFGFHFFSWAALLSFVFFMAAHILTFAVAMNVLTHHGACTILWTAVGTALSVLLTSPRTLKKVSYLSVFSFASIIAATFTLMISLGVAPAGPSAPGASWEEPSDFLLLAAYYTLTPTFMALLNICIAFMGNVAFFGFISELRQPADFPKSLLLQQTISIAFYIVVGAVVYSFVGTAAMPSPALGATSPIIQKISYGVAMPTIVVAGVINAHVACKQVYVQMWTRWFEQPAVITKKGVKAVGSWFAIVATLWLAALLLALAIPVFHEMLGLVSALFGSWFTYGVSGMFWISMNLEGIFRRPKVGESENELSGSFWRRMGYKKLALLILNVVMIAVGATLCGLGLYASVKEIVASDKGQAFSCANNTPEGVTP